MKPKSILQNLLICIILLGLTLSACTPQPTPVPNNIENTVAPTVDMSMLETQVAETVYAEFTLAALIQPFTETPIPPTVTPLLQGTQVTNTPFILSTNTLVNVPPETTQWVATAAPAKTSTPEDKNFQCLILSQTIAYEEVMFPGETFEAGWTIENVGKAYWSDAGLDIVYVSGTEMHRVSSPIDLSQDVPPTGNFSFSITMKAPSTPGYYQTSWIFQGDPGTFCPLFVRIEVR
ncbi:MAG: hypothetical protein JEZ00_18470 [Anaerolineaceae bacterium]|nr:hypothetical protein [Anaerolineaceae bacterium]